MIEKNTNHERNICHGKGGAQVAELLLVVDNTLEGNKNYASNNNP